MTTRCISPTETPATQRGKDPMFKLSCSARQLHRKLANYRPNLYRMAYAWCGDHSLADDLVQETILKSLEKSAQLRDIDKFAPWCCRILHNCWLTHLRGIRPNVALDEIVLCCDDCPESHYHDLQRGEALRLAIAKLPQGQRKVLMLIDLEGFSYREVADILSIPVGTVMSRISRARTALERTLTAQKNAAEREMRHGIARLRRIK